MKFLRQIFLILLVPCVASAAPLAVTFTSSTGPGPTVAIYVHNNTASTAYLAITGHATGTWPGGYTIPNNAAVNVNWATLAPGATYTAYNAYTFGGGVNCSSFSSTGVVGADSASGGAIVQSYSFSGSGGGILTFDIGVPPPCTTNAYTPRIINNTTHDAYFAVMDQMGNVLSASVGLQPGESRVLGYGGVPCGNVPLIVVPVDSSSVSVTNSGSYSSPTNYAGSGGTNTIWTINPDPAKVYVSTNADGSLVLGGPPPATYNPTNQTSPIIWTAGSSTNAASGIQQGMDALYDSQSKAASQEHSDLEALQDLVISNTTVLSGRLVSLTNGFGLGLTNVATETTLSGISNVLGGVGESTNFTTNWTVEVAVPTNYASALAASASASTDLSGAESSMQSFLDAMNPVSIDDGWASPDMVYTFNLGVAGTRTMDLNPMNDPSFAAIFTASKNLFAWLLAILYMVRCAKDSANAMALCNQARGVVVSSPTTKKTYN